MKETKNKPKSADHRDSAVNSSETQEPSKLCFIDLFCGCGGFTLGMTRSGFHCLAAIDWDQKAVDTLQSNVDGLDHVLQRDLTQFQPEELSALIGRKSVDVIVGGPPCQGFSTARQVDGTNHGMRLTPDPRRNLFRILLKYVDYFQPRIFVMENVLGLRSASGGEYMAAVQAEARVLGLTKGGPGYRVHGQIEDAWKLGVPQKRRRQLIIGVRADIPSYFPPKLKISPRSIPFPVLGDAIGDLPVLEAGQGEDEQEYRHVKRSPMRQPEDDKTRKYLNEVLEIEKTTCLTNHVARPHNARDLRDFNRLNEGENSATAIRDRKVEFEFPYDKASFKDRFTRQSRSGPCSTIVAHLSKDGLMFIHPTQNRSLTPREAARIQSFPDWFRFPATRTHSFRMIGNAVPPLVAEAIGITIRSFLEKDMKANKNVIKQVLIPEDEEQAYEWIKPLLGLNQTKLRDFSDESFRRAWHSIAFLYPGLHPDGALDHGTRTMSEHNQTKEPRFSDTRLSVPYYTQSGWPVVLEPVATEAWRRYRNGVLTDDEFYCSDVQMAGLIFRSATS